jgi:hypothetical protein
MEQEMVTEHKSESEEVSVDRNTFDELLTVIAQSIDSVEQRRNLLEYIGTLHRPSLSRKIFAILFPAVEASRRVR